MGRDLQALTTRLLVLANALFACAGAVVCLGLWINPSIFAPEAGAEVAATLGRGPLRWGALVGGPILVANLLWVFYVRNRRRDVPHIVSEGVSGPILIAREAIVSGLQKAGEELEEVTRVRVSLESRGLRRIVVTGSFQAPEGVAVQEAGQKLRSTLAGAFFDLVRLGDDRRLEVAIEFTGRSGRPIKRKDDPGDEAARENEEEEARPFTGPQYPIEEDDPYRGSA